VNLTGAIILCCDKSLKSQYSKSAEVAKSTEDGGLSSPLPKSRKARLLAQTVSFDSLFSTSFQNTVSFSNSKLSNYLEVINSPKESNLQMVFLPSESRVSVCQEAFHTLLIF